ncbi:MAG: hypothetical protein ACPG19_01385 [Saprospiraceae bacterium]
MINDFLFKNWFDLLQSIFILGGFILSFIATQNDIRSRKVEHLLYLNQSYREIWAKTYTYPELLRIRETDIDLKTNPITAPERRMIREMVIHIYAIYEAIQNNQIEKGETDKDIYDFLQLPIPNVVWEEVKVYHNKKFIDYIDELLSKHRRVSKSIHLWD